MNNLSEQARFEQYRLMLISTWPESSTKQASLASARAVLERELAFNQSRPDEPVVEVDVAA